MEVARSIFSVAIYSLQGNSANNHRMTDDVFPRKRNIVNDQQAQPVGAGLGNRVGLSLLVQLSIRTIVPPRQLRHLRSQ